MSNNLQIPSLWPKSEFLNWFWHIFMVCSVGNNIHRRSTSITICCRILKWCQTFRKIFNFKNALVLWLCWWIIVFSDTSVRQKFYFRMAPSADVSGQPKATYKTVTGVNGPLVILDKVKVSQGYFWSFFIIILLVCQICRNRPIETIRWNDTNWSSFGSVWR